MYEYNRISFEAREHAERRAQEAATERIAHHARTASRRQRRRRLHEALQLALAGRRQRLARQS